jgi:hypothetical protein
MGNVNACCNLNDFNVFKSKEKKVLDDISSKALGRLIRIQSVWKAILTRQRFQKKFKNKNLRAITKYYVTPDGFSDSQIPGKVIDVSTIQIHENVFTTEQKLGDFVIEEKELIKFIEKNKIKLKNYSILYDDGSIYYGYYNKFWEREGYGVYILPDGSKYQGFFKNNRMNGRGRLVGIDGDYFEGILLNIIV